MARFAKGTNIRISADTTSYEHEFVTPDSITVTVFKGATVVLNPIAMVNTGETGKYYYNWQSSDSLAPGKYECKVVAERNSRFSIEHDERAFYLY